MHSDNLVVPNDAELDQLASLVDAFTIAVEWPMSEVGDLFDPEGTIVSFPDGSVASLVELGILER